MLPAWVEVAALSIMITALGLAFPLYAWLGDREQRRFLDSLDRERD